MTSNQRTNDKIKDLDDLASLLGQEKSLGKKVVMCHGVFDLLHIGHIRHFEEAGSFGDVLVVTITPDRFVNKGPGRPVFSEGLRAEAVAALACVDYVSINWWPISVETIQLLRPDFYVKGSDYSDPDDDRSGGIILEENAVKSVGGSIKFTDDVTSSSSHLINRHLPVFSDGVKEFVAGFTAKHSFGEVIGYLEGAQQLRVLVLGETIIDEYVYCQTLGKSGKEPVLATKQLDTELFAGGIVAVANHMAAFCNRIGLLSFLGSVDSYEDFVKENLRAGIDSTFLCLEDDAPTILKRRFVESYPFQKLFELYVMNGGEPNPVETQALCSELEMLLPQYDMVLVTDYGHGMIGPEAVDLLCDKSKFLAINTQANAGNLGFNTVSKYHKADFICVSENEIRLDARSRRKDLREIVKDVSERLSCRRILVTRGQNGCLCYGEDEGCIEMPALTNRVVDRVGAGDAVFSAASVCAAQGAPMEIVGLVGNIAGAGAIATMGHRNSTDSASLIMHIKTLMK